MGPIKPKDTKEIQKLSGRDGKQRHLEGSKRSWGVGDGVGKRWSGGEVRERRGQGGPEGLSQVLRGHREWGCGGTREGGAPGRGWQRQGAREKQGRIGGGRAAEDGASRRAREDGEWVGVEERAQEGR